MTSTFTRPEGFDDLWANEASFYAWIENRLLESLDSNGFNRVMLPSLEYIDLYHPERTGIGPFSNLILGTIGEWRRFFSGLEVDEDGKNLQALEETNEVALRPELTASMIRAVVERFEHESGSMRTPVRACSAGRVFQDLDPATRLKEWGQVDAEIVGSTDVLHDAELLVICSRVLKDLGIESFSFHLGYTALYECLLRGLNVQERHVSTVLSGIRLAAFTDSLSKLTNKQFGPYLPGIRARLIGQFERMSELYGWISEKDRPPELSKDVGIGDYSLTFWKKRLPEIHESLIRSAWIHSLHLDAKTIDEVLSLKNLRGDWTSFKKLVQPKIAGDKKAREHFKRFETIYRLAEKQGVPLCVDPPAGRGFAYYNGLTFEARVPGLVEPVARGGRYDSLVEWICNRFRKTVLRNGSPNGEDRLPRGAVGLAFSTEALMQAIPLDAVTDSQPTIDVKVSENRFSDYFRLMDSLRGSGLRWRLLGESDGDSATLEIRADGQCRLKGKRGWMNFEKCVEALLQRAGKRR